MILVDASNKQLGHLGKRTKTTNYEGGKEQDTVTTGAVYIHIWKCEPLLSLITLIHFTSSNQLSPLPALNMPQFHLVTLLLSYSEYEK